MPDRASERPNRSLAAVSLPKLLIQRPDQRVDRNRILRPIVIDADLDALIGDGERSAGLGRAHLSQRHRNSAASGPTRHRRLDIAAGGIAVPVQLGVTPAPTLTESQITASTAVGALSDGEALLDTQRSVYVPLVWTSRSDATRLPCVFIVAAASSLTAPLAAKAGQGQIQRAMLITSLTRAGPACTRRPLRPLTATALRRWPGSAPPALLLGSARGIQPRVGLHRRDVGRAQPGEAGMPLASSAGAAGPGSREPRSTPAAQAVPGCTEVPAAANTSRDEDHKTRTEA